MRISRRTKAILVVPIVSLALPPLLGAGMGPVELLLWLVVTVGLIWWAARHYAGEEEERRIECRSRRSVCTW